MKFAKRTFMFTTALAVVLVLGAGAVQSAQGQTFTLVHTFAGAPDGAFPSGLVEDAAGNLYGTTQQGGITTGVCASAGVDGLKGCGTVFKVDSTGIETVLYRFAGGTDAQFPTAGLVRDASGNLYGATPVGGASNKGAVFKVDPAGNETVLYNFTGGADGWAPQGTLVLDAAGNLYGTTQGGGASMQGTVFKLDTAAKETVVYSFTGPPDGAHPVAGLVQDGAGNLYGTTPVGGAFGAGTVFKVDATGTETVLHSFTGSADGGSPEAGLILDGAGNLYGTTTMGGALNCLGGQNNPVGCGAVFKLSSTEAETVYNFTPDSGDFPNVGLVRDAAGNLYGTTEFTGPHAGTSAVLFEMNTSGGETVLFTFKGGGLGRTYPTGSLVLDAAGNLYGTTQYGGSVGAGTVFKFNPTGAPTFPLTIAPSGNGSGTVMGNLPGIDCPSACSAFYAPGTVVTLTATAGTGSSFSSWGVAGCTGTGTCKVTTGTAETVVFATFILDFSISASALAPATVSPGGSSTATVNVSALAGFNGSVALTCAVTPTPLLAPTCSVVPNSVAPGTPATLTVSTTGPGAGLVRPNPGPRLFYALYLPLIGLATGAGLGSKQKKWKQSLTVAALTCVLFAGAVFQVACGGGSSSPGSSGTPVGTYTIAITGKDATGTLLHATTTTLKVR